MNNLPSVDRAAYDRDGFLHLKNILNAEEVAQLKQVCYNTIEDDKEKGTMFLHRYAKNHIGDLVNIDTFKNLILDDRIVHIASTLLGERPSYFGDSIFEIGTGSRGFHKDTSNRTDPNHPDWTNDYPILRIAFYLQDHENHSGGLKVRIGSHNTLSTSEGKAVFVPSHPGDAIAFCLRTSHAGNGVRLKFAPELSISHLLEKRVPSFLRIPEEKERVSIFLTFGLKSACLDRYINFMHNHKVYSERIAASEYPENLVNAINEKVDFINLKEYKPQV